MNVLITGADGFIGRALVARLLADPRGDAAQLTLIDQRFTAPAADTRVRQVSGDFGDANVLTAAVEPAPDLVFHLASVPGGMAEAQYELGLRVNLQATVSLLECLRRQARAPRVVFASTIGVYGVPMPALIDEDTVPAPSLSYGAHKLIGEILMTDCSRRGFVDARCLRLPGIVARPANASGMLSAFLSDMIRSLWAHQPFRVPVPARGKSWWMSRSCVVDNLLHAARLTPDVAEKRRVWLLPVLHASMAEVVAAIARRRGADVLERVSYDPDARLEAQFASYPPLACPQSVAAGFRDDGTLEALVERALDPP